MESISTAWQAPAKLNLFLHVIGRRHDGYHQLQTAFQFINLSDEIDFTLLDTDTVTLKMRDCAGLTGNTRDWQTKIAALPDENNLAVKAALLLKKHTASTKGVDIQIKKAIPTGGGLGGGSSDAATTLVALNQLWHTQLSTHELMQLGIKLGADVPIFIHAQAAWAEGIGEEFTPIAPKECCYLLIYPGCHVDTATVFNADDLTRNTPPITIQQFLKKKKKNDFETIVLKHYSEVGNAFNWLNRHAVARLTGTGSCIFAPFLNEEQATTIKDDLPPQWDGYIVKGMNRSPLLERLHKEQTKI